MQHLPPDSPLPTHSLVTLSHKCACTHTDTKPFSQLYCALTPTDTHAYTNIFIYSMSKGSKPICFASSASIGYLGLSQGQRNRDPLLTNMVTGMDKKIDGHN